MKDNAIQTDGSTPPLGFKASGITGARPISATGAGDQVVSKTDPTDEKRTGVDHSPKKNSGAKPRSAKTYRSPIGNKVSEFLATGLAIISVGVMGLMPIAAAIDFGGVLWWTQFAFAAITCFLTCAALVQVVVLGDRYKLIHLWPILPAGFVVGYAIAQTVSLPDTLTSLIAPASYTAYREYAGAILPATGRTMASTHAISVEPEQTLHFASLLAAAVALFWSASQILVTRRRAIGLLSIIALSGVALTAIGLLKMLLPEFEILGYGGNTQTFANFVNRNNAALFLNYTAAVSLGLLAWRLATVSGHEFDEDDFELNDMFSLIGESESLVAAFGLLASISGLLVCGSRGGLVAMVAGLLLGFGWIHRRRGRRQILVVATAFGLGLVLLLAPLQLNLRSLTRLEGFVSADFSTLTLDGRWTHWKDGLSAAWGYFPLGSGAGTYGTAHLPYLDHGGRALFLHADNLWLEWFVELGAVGVAAILTILVLAVSALRKLTHSSDPLDHGIRVAGWYMLAATLVSQLFDFGLLMPANFIILVLTFAIVFYRASEQTSIKPKSIVGTALERLAIVNNVSSKWQSYRFGSEIKRGFALLLAIIVLSSVFIAANRLRKNAHIEAIVMAAEQPRSGALPEQEALTVSAEKLRLHASSSPRAAITLTGIELARGRVADTLAANPTSLSDGLSIYQSTAPLVRRLNSTVVATDGVTDLVTGEPTTYSISNRGGEHYQAALDSLGNALHAAPLSVVARRYALFLDFFHGNKEVSTTAIDQLADFYLGQPRAMLSLARYAAESGHPETAAVLVSQSMTVAPYLTNFALRLLNQHKQIDVNSAIPDNPETFVLSAKWLVDQFGRPDSRPIPIDKSLIERAIKAVSAMPTKSVADQVARYKTIGDLSYAIDRKAEAFEVYRRAISIDPGNWDLRKQVISQLRSSNRVQEAKELAIQAGTFDPDNEAIEQLIRQITDEEISSTKN